MSSSLIRKHAGNGAASDQPTVPEPSFSERARTLGYFGRIGSLSTLSRKQPGFPFGSVMPYGLDEHGRPIFLISTMAMHTQNLQADSRASLLVTQPNASADPLGASRVTLMGNVLAIPESGVAEARRLYLERYVNSKYWVDFEDFSFYRMDVVDVYYVGGFGVMGWVPASEYAQAHPDPLADATGEIVQHMNTGPQGCAHPACPGVCWHRVAGGSDDFGGPPRFSSALEYPRWHAGRPHRILARSEQSGGSQKSSDGDGAAG
jgi:heme iron utilization protein